jgi:hypothetical protein
LNIGVVARRNFEAGIDINGIIMGLIDQNLPIDPGLNIAVVLKLISWGEA